MPSTCILRPCSQLLHKKNYNKWTRTAFPSGLRLSRDDMVTRCFYKYPIPNTKNGRGPVLFRGRADSKDPVAEELEQHPKRRHRPPEQQVRNGEKRRPARHESVSALLEPLHHVPEEDGPDNRSRRCCLPRLPAKHILLPAVPGDLFYPADYPEQFARHNVSRGSAL